MNRSALHENARGPTRENSGPGRAPAVLSVVVASDAPFPYDGPIGAGQSRVWRGARAAMTAVRHLPVLREL